MDRGKTAAEIDHNKSGARPPELRRNFPDPACTKCGDIRTVRHVPFGNDLDHVGRQACTTEFPHLAGFRTP